MTDELEAKQYCSFCGVPTDEVEYMVRGPAVVICENCVAACAQIIMDAKHQNAEIFQAFVEADNE